MIQQACNQIGRLREAAVNIYAGNTLARGSTTVDDEPLRHPSSELLLQQNGDRGRTVSGRKENGDSLEWDMGKVRLEPGRSHWRPCASDDTASLNWGQTKMWRGEGLRCLQGPILKHQYGVPHKTRQSRHRRRLHPHPPQTCTEERRNGGTCATHRPAPASQTCF